jgi:beta-galactosidase
MLLYFSFLLAICLFLPTCNAARLNEERTFEIDYSNHQFLKDGKPFRYIAGQIEYFRIPPELWHDRLMRLRHAGLNAIQIYVPWNFHETFENQFNFDGMANITAFIKSAQAQNLYVILRPGPYICAEWENGGLPYWLIKKKGIQLRVYNQPYISAVENYFNHLLPLIKPLLYINGGNILMVQIENEYGSYNCDKKYLGFLRDLAKKHLGNDVVLYTTDPPAVIQCGSVDGVFATVDFGVNDDTTVKKNFEIQQKYANGGPIVNSEFYPGWFTVWNYGNATLPTTQKVLDTMNSMYNSNASFSFYMFHGGTNFDFWNGAEVYGAVITSYDYGAPVAENGAITPQYLAIQDWIKKLPNWNSPPLETPPNNPVQGFGTVTMKMTDTLRLAFSGSTTNESCKQTDLPLSFEELDHPYGFVIYSTQLSFVGSTLKAENIKDHGYVYINDKPQGVLVGNIDIFGKRSLPIRNVNKGDILTIIVENRGRQTFLSILDSKGLLPNVTLGNSVITKWSSCPIDLNKIVSTALNTSKFENFNPKTDFSEREKNPFDQSGDTAGIYVGSFVITGDITDTWFNPGQFRKGQFFINGNNLGRYWPTGGPQTTLYVPASMLKKNNIVVLIELLGRGTDSTVSFDEKPYFG